MINAKQAREKASSKSNTKIASVLKKIEEGINDAVEEGKMSCKVNVVSLDTYMQGNIAKILRDQGFRITHNEGSDQRDGESWSILNIEW